MITINYIKYMYLRVMYLVKILRAYVHFITQISHESLEGSVLPLWGLLKLELYLLENRNYSTEIVFIYGYSSRDVVQVAKFTEARYLKNWKFIIGSVCSRMAADRLLFYMKEFIEYPL